jgi:hypothetical protein
MNNTFWLLTLELLDTSMRPQLLLATASKNSVACGMSRLESLQRRKLELSVVFFRAHVSCSEAEAGFAMLVLKRG